MTTSPVEVIKIEINVRTFSVRPISPDVLKSRSVLAEMLAVSLDKKLPWSVGFFFGNTELSMELWTVIDGISGSMIRVLLNGQFIDVLRQIFSGFPGFSENAVGRNLTICHTGRSKCKV